MLLGHRTETAFHARGLLGHRWRANGVLDSRFRGNDGWGGAGMTGGGAGNGDGADRGKRNGKRSGLLRILPMLGPAL